MGPDRHAQLDHFGIVFPFPLRLALILVAGMFSDLILLFGLTLADRVVLKAFGDGVSTSTIFIKIA